MTVTNIQIEALSRLAAAVGDRAQVARCALALDASSPRALAARAACARLLAPPAAGTAFQVVALLPDGQCIDDEAHVGPHAGRTYATAVIAQYACRALEADRPEGHEAVRYAVRPIVVEDVPEADDPLCVLDVEPALACASVEDAAAAIGAPLAVQDDALVTGDGVPVGRLLDPDEARPHAVLDDIGIRLEWVRDAVPLEAVRVAYRAAADALRQSDPSCVETVLDCDDTGRPVDVWPDVPAIAVRAWRLPNGGASCR